MLSFKEIDDASYSKDELLVILAGIGIFGGTFIIGLVPTLVVFLFLWVRIFEKASWKVTLIIMAIAMFITVIVFGTWIGIQFPLGLFENILG